MMIAFTYLPGFVTVIWHGMPTMWRDRHHLLLCWLVFMQAVTPGRTTLEEMARWAPAAITAWRFGRLLKAASWNMHLIVRWLAHDLVTTLPAPHNGVLYLFGDSSHADKRGTKNPIAQPGRTSQHHPWFFGLRFVLLMAAWDGYRVPVGFRLILPKRHAAYRSAKVLFREMVGEFAPPRWAKMVIVGGDAAYGSKDTMRMVQDRDKADSARRWGCVFAIARTWKTVEEKTLKHLVTHVPHTDYQRTRVPREPAGRGRRTFWTYYTHLSLRHVGDVTIVLSKKGRNLSPKQTKIPHASAFRGGAGHRSAHPSGGAAGAREAPGAWWAAPACPATVAGRQGTARRGPPGVHVRLAGATRLGAPPWGRPAVPGAALPLAGLRRVR